MWDDLGSAVSSALAVPADAALRTLLSLLVVYCCTAVPLVLWALSRTFQWQSKVRSTLPGSGSFPQLLHCLVLARIHTELLLKKAGGQHQACWNATAACQRAEHCV